MNRKAVPAIVLVLLLTSMLTLALEIKMGRSILRIITVPDDFPTIQEAINNAIEGDNIIVRAGTYFEHVTVGKSLTLLGEDREVTIIDGNMTGNVVWITQDHVNIRGFTIQRSGQAFSNSGIYVGSTQHCDISANCIVDNEFGVFGAPRNMSITDNTIDGNFLGVALDSGATNNVISRNHLVANYVSVHLNLADANCILQNNVTNNWRSVTLWDSKDNRLYHNNFLNNTFGSVTYANFLDNGCEGNYWSDYNGTDIDGDGVGDTPYVIDTYNSDNCPLMNPFFEGDVNHDTAVDIYDIILPAFAYGSAPSDINWNPHADVVQDNVIDIHDLLLVAVNFGEKYP